MSTTQSTSRLPASRPDSTIQTPALSPSNSAGPSPALSVLQSPAVSEFDLENPFDKIGYEDDEAVMPECWGHRGASASFRKSSFRASSAPRYTIAVLLSGHHRCHCHTIWSESGPGGGSRTNSTNHVPSFDHPMDMCHSCRSRIHHLIRCLVICHGFRHLQRRIQSPPLLRHARPVPMVSRRVSTRLYYDVRLLTTWIRHPRDY